MNQSLTQSEIKAKSCCSSVARDEPCVCFHCAGPIPEFSDISLDVEGAKQAVCSYDCKTAAQFIHSHKLSQFYRHQEAANSRHNLNSRQEKAAGSSKAASNQDWCYLDTPEAAQQYLLIGNDRREMAISVHGLYCSSCSWLIESGLQSLSSSIRVRVDVTANVVHVTLTDVAVKVSQIFSVISDLGYAPQPILKHVMGALEQSSIDTERKLYLKRIAVAGLGMMQVMTYAVATYFGEYQGIDAGMHRFFTLISMLVATVVVFYSGSLFFNNAWNDLKNRHLGMDVPVALAVGAAYFPSVYLTLTNTPGHIYFDSAVMFVFFLLLGRYLEMRARYRLSETPAAVMRLLPNFIEVIRGEDTTLIRPDQVKRGDQLHLSALNAVPFDAVLLNGGAFVDESLLTGEVEAQSKGVGDQLLAGSQMVAGQATLQAVNDWAESSIARLEQLLSQGREIRSHQQNVLSKVGRGFIAAVLILTAMVGLFWSFYNPDGVFHVVLAMLIAACPCAFSLAIPVGVTAASTALRKKGVLLANSTALQTINDIDTWCFDKTGTLTEGRCEIVEVRPLAALSVESCLKIAASLEQGSQHALAYAFRSIESDEMVTDFDQAVGNGIAGTIGGDRYWLGKREWAMAHFENANCPQADSVVSTDSNLQQVSELLLADKQGPLATILVADKVRDSVKPFIAELKRQHKRVMILSGDAQPVVSSVAGHLQADKAFGRLLPVDKVRMVEQLQAKGGRVVMLGDGVNDAQVLQQADISIVMASGSELSQAQADVVLLHGRFEQLPLLVKVARRTQQITRQNLFWALGYNLVALPLAASGLLTPWVAALGMSSSSLIVVLNALRISKTTKA